jgi:hypothetical protein
MVKRKLNGYDVQLVKENFVWITNGPNVGSIDILSGAKAVDGASNTRVRVLANMVSRTEWCKAGERTERVPQRHLLYQLWNTGVVQAETVIEAIHGRQ